ncbi:MAG: AAA family ATPase [Pseudomonadota bacterium]|nr:AAA family ATPase [Pseudomonadota bacterium]
MDGLGRINLLVGKNNSGKTSVLEALYLLAANGDPCSKLARQNSGIGTNSGNRARHHFWSLDNARQQESRNA